MCRFYGRERPNEVQVEFWYNAFKDTNERVFEKGIRMCIEKEKVYGFPDICQVMQYIKKPQEGLWPED